MARPHRRFPLLDAAAGLAIACFAIVLAARLAGRPLVPSQAVAPLAALALLLSLVIVVRTLRSIRTGPGPRRFPSQQAIRLGGAEAETVRQSALQRGTEGGAGYVHPWRQLLPAAGLAALSSVLLSGLLNVALHIEGTWVQFSDSGRDLDLGSTYRELSLGLLADPAELKYGVLIGEVRPQEPSRLADLKVIDSTGATVLETVIGPGLAASFRGIGLYQWAVGPGVHVTVVQVEQGQLLDQPVPLWPAGAPGSWAETLEGRGIQLGLRLDGWPASGAEGTTLHATLRRGDELLYDGAVEPRRVKRGRDGYAVMAWEVRPYVGLGLAHRTFRGATLWSVIALAAFLLAWPFFPARPFWYREEADGCIVLHPPSVIAALQRVGR